MLEKQDQFPRERQIVNRRFAVNLLTQGCYDRVAVICLTSFHQKLVKQDCIACHTNNNYSRYTCYG